MSDDPTRQTAASPARRTPRRGPETARDGDDRLSRATLVGRYLVIEPLGEGGMGVVYKAYDPELDRKIALKLVHAGDGTGSGGDHERLLREAHAMAKLSHPNVVPIFDVGAFGARVFLAMELVDGTTLRGWLKKPRGWRESLDVLTAAGRGLAAAHAAGLIHRDFKPENVLIGTDGRARVTDFGLARSEHARVEEVVDEMPGLRDSGPLDTELTAAGSIVGTPAYMAPEQIKAGTLDARTDQFAYCIVLYEALYGVRPFDSKGDDRLAAIEAGQLREPATAVRVPARIRRAIVKGLAADPQARHASLDALLAELAIDPERTRWLVPAGGLALAAVAVAIGLGRRADAPAPCVDAGAKSATIWNATVKLGMQQRFVATGSPYARDAWNAVSANLDTYAQAWSAMRVDTCEATQVRREQTPDVMTLRMTCLDQRHNELADLIEVLDSADAAMMVKAPVATKQLVPVDVCADVAALQAPVALPASAEARAEIAALQDQLAKARALRIAGRYQASLAIVEPLIPRITKAAYRPLEAELDVGLGKLYDYLGEPKKALDAAVAGFIAAEGGNDQGLKLDLAGLIAAIAAQNGNLALAKQYTALGLAILEHVHDDRRRLEVLTNIGVVEGIVPDLQSCITHMRAAIDLQRRRDPEDINIVPPQIDLANCLLNSGRYDEATHELEVALALVRKIFPNHDHPVVGAIFYNLGMIAESRGDLATALADYEQTYAISVAASGPDHRSSIEARSRIGEAKAEMGDYHEALAILEPLVQKHADNPDLQVGVSIMLSAFCEALLGNGDIDRAEQAGRRALAVDTKLYGEAQNADLDHVLIADVLAAKGKHAAAIDELRIADGIEKKRAEPSDVRCHLLTSLGVSQLALHDAAAIATLEEAVTLADKLHVSPYERALARFTLARALGKTPRAFELARKARDEFGQAYDRGTKARVQVDAWLAANGQ